jgi:hypothetical protein
MITGFRLGVKWKNRVWPLASRSGYGLG